MPMSGTELRARIAFGEYRQNPDAVAGPAIWEDLDRKERAQWRTLARTFAADPELTVAKAYDDEILRLAAESWRWGWERNEQIKTDPIMNPNLPSPASRDLLLRMSLARTAARL